MSTLLELDRSALLNLTGWITPDSAIAQLISFIAQWLVYALVAILIIAWFWPTSAKASTFAQVAVDRLAGRTAPHRERHRLLLVRTTLVALIAWYGVTKPLGLLLGRPRPFEGVGGVQELLFHRPDYSFPSDHTTFLMALAVGFLMGGNRQLGWIFLVGAMLVATSRVLAGLHFPGDILGGLAVAVLVVLVLHPARKTLDTYVGRPLLELAHKLRLA